MGGCIVRLVQELVISKSLVGELIGGQWMDGVWLGGCTY